MVRRRKRSDTSWVSEGLTSLSHVCYVCTEPGDGLVSLARLVSTSSLRGDGGGTIPFHSGTGPEGGLFPKGEFQSISIGANE